MTICDECDAGFHSQCEGANGCDCDCNYEPFFSEDLIDMLSEEQCPHGYVWGDCAKCVPATEESK